MESHIMSLPKLDVTPKYDVLIPSINKMVKFRPYLVKEEKTLLLAMESEDSTQIINAVADVVVACISEDIDKRKLTTFDIEYLMVKIRAKSVGENPAIALKCSECEESNEVKVNIDDIEMDVGKTDNIIHLTDTISIKMKYPSFTDIGTSTAITQAESEVEQSFLVVIKCIDSIQTEDENIAVKDVDEKELIEFLESFTSAQYLKIKTFIEGIPSIESTVNFTCTKCETENTVTLKGMTDFF